MRITRKKCAGGYLHLQRFRDTSVPPDPATVRERLAAQLEEIVRKWERQCAQDSNIQEST